MKKHLSILSLLLFFSVFTNLKSQITVQTNTEQKKHRIVFQLTTADTSIHKMMVKNISNILSIAPDTEIEVVSHGPGISFLMNEKTIVHDKIIKLSEKGVRFVGCEFTLKDKNISKSEIVKEAGFVESGAMEIVLKQEQGWSYLRATN